MKDGVVLTINRQQASTMLAHRVHEQLARHHQDFLVGQHDPFTGSRRGQRRLKTRSADNGRHDRIDLGQSRQFDQRFDTVAHLCRQAGSTATLCQLRRQRDIAQHRKMRAELKTLLVQLVDLAMRAQGKGPIALGMPAYDIQCTDANRSGRTQNCDVLNCHAER
ncbi:hypothetical protein SDC9_132066 [bioreactor metagenome]|uniref:Uncharacterized protein n=1 Tax=bioreactor metagenome TaxID=1076179 RepID=A0A645D6Z4_9ZZZZ